ncbi:MAG: DegV family protein [Clostridia bacterium]|nr:DegV family protein [Clostridia bacterium]
MKIAIVTDSNSGITQKEAQELGITVIPMPFLIDGEEYFEDINLSQSEFYEKLNSGAEVSTSQPSIFSVTETWDKLLKTYDQIIHIPMSSGLSGSTESAKTKAAEYNGKVFVIDNKRISVTQKQSVLDAINMVHDGKTAKDIAEWLEKTGGESSIYIMLTTLKYLKKGGRITPAAAALGTLFKIKPILTIQGGKLDKFHQVISYAQGKNKMIEQVAKELASRFKASVSSGKFKVFVAHTNIEAKALEFEKEINSAFEKFNLKVEFVNPLSLSVACHIGDGSLAIAASICY